MLFKDWVAKNHPDLNSLKEFRRRMMKAARELNQPPVRGVNSEELLFSVNVYARVFGLTPEEMQASFETANVVQFEEPTVPVVMDREEH
ncbi:hypothetical protein RQ831_18155 [Roseomonas gilardii]|uniref:Uncharacterized protein n=1 Tax=Roseomonas gilardii TaxID=257708 RepID=A0ABU3MJ02_9PROT|nr:hypothetical protein [Roseomonas gilardii]MDT8332979.1 hypothetical protein [Roseomonas gilardii]